jgi:hypothetical protein
MPSVSTISEIVRGSLSPLPLSLRNTLTPLRPA